MSTEILGLTIDSKQSKYLDDAFWLQETSTGYLLTVLIPNVTKYVKPGSLIDKAIKRNQFSIYQRGSGVFVKPMLTRELKSRLSLEPLEKRNVIRFSIALSRDLNTRELVSVKESVFANQYRLTHVQVKNILVNTGHVLNDQIRLLTDVAKRLLDIRRASKVPVICDIDSGGAVNETDVVEALDEGYHKIGFVIVQEFMVLTNSVVSEYCMKNDIPIMYRYQQEQSAEAEASKVFIPDAGSRNRGFLSLLNKYIGPVTKAGMTGKSGESQDRSDTPCYSLFTSPLRRYPDYINQQVLLAHLQRQNSPDSGDMSEALGLPHDDHVQLMLNKYNASPKREKKLKQYNFSELNANELHQILRLVLVDGYSGNKKLIAEIKRRMSSEKLDEKTLALMIRYGGLIFEMDVKYAIIELLHQEPYRAVIILKILQKKREVDNVSLEEKTVDTENAKGFTFNARFSIEGKVYSSDASAKTKKVASRQAAVSVLQQLLGIAEGLDKKPKRLLNPKSELHGWCQKNEFDMPVYVTEKEGSAHSPRFTTTVIVSINGQPVKEVGAVSTSKKAAEQAAALAWLNSK